VRPLNAAELLNVWECGLNQPDLQRALIIIAAASTELDSQAVAKLSIGARDARLLQLREWMFGSVLLNTAQCPECQERVEWEGKTTDLRLQAIDDTNPAEQYSLKVDDYQLLFHPPTSLDIAAVIKLVQHDGERGDSLNVGTALASRCIISAEHMGKTCNFTELPQQVLDALGRKIEALDPQAEIRTELICPACSHRWQIQFDIAGFLWAEINAWAERTLGAIHRLASAYGWTETEILNLSPVRRQLYLGMLDR